MLYTKPKVIRCPSLPENVEKFKKAKGSYTKMSIFFDENFYSDDRDDETCYMYMYLIYYMLICKRGLLRNYKDYDSYAQYAANTVYMRFMRKQENGERIKSLLNYAKSTVYPLKIGWQNQAFQYTTDVNKEHGVEKSKAIDTYIRDGIRTDYENSGEYQYVIENAYKSIFSIARKIINNSPYKNDLQMCQNLYMSCIMTLLKGVTLSEHNKEIICNKKDEGKLIRDSTIVRIYRRELSSSVTLWQLPISMKDYIRVLTNEIMTELFNNVEEEKLLSSMTDSDIDVVMKNNWSDVSMNKGEDD